MREPDRVVLVGLKLVRKAQREVVVSTLTSTVLVLQERVGLEELAVDPTGSLIDFF